jgi:2-C-methyl-D-erythritol 4-phosphate cytidylyltransferase / 2-C-methyl-D-erythritol 2,4-cyclodiphosphate synthase
VVVAGGRGVRLGADRPKQYLSCAGRPLIVHTLEALAASFPFSAVTVVIGPDDQALYDEAVAHLTVSPAAPLGPPAIGGATRQQSVLAGRDPSRQSPSWRARSKPPSATGRLRPERR